MSDLQNARNLLQKCLIEGEGQLRAASSRQALIEEKSRVLGKTGPLGELMRLMATLGREEKPEFGKEINRVKSQLEAVFEEAMATLVSKELNERIEAERLDMTLPGTGVRVGAQHPVSLVTEQIVRILAKQGYSLKLGPLIETQFFNFEALNVPEDHPAREMQDTFFIDQDHVLRTHTSPIQIHVYQNEKPPIRMLGTGAVFRCDSDVSHLPHFHQIEGICVDRKVSMADLKGTIRSFVREFFARDLKVRFRPSFFPFTEPSAEVDCTCPICEGRGCSMCKGSGWIEIGGSGLVHPRVFEQSGIDPNEWQGFAFGFGIERMAIIKYGIPDIRLLPQNDQRFIRQFGGVL